MSAKTQAQKAYNRYKQAQKNQKKKKVVNTQTRQQQKTNQAVTKRATGNYSSFKGVNPGRTSEGSVQNTTSKRYTQEEAPARRNQQELQRQRREHQTQTSGQRMSSEGQSRFSNLTKGALEQSVGSARKAFSGFMSGVTENRAKGDTYGGTQAHRNGTQQYMTRRTDRLSPEQLQDRETGIQKSKATSRALSEAQNLYTKQESKAASKQIARGTEKIEKGKEGLGAVGRFGADLYTGAVQLGADIGIGALTGSALWPMGVRAFGGAVDEAEQAGASWKKQMGYGLATAGIELGTEKLFNVGSALNKAYGAGVGDKLVDKLTKKVGKSALKGGLSEIGAATFTEALEEMVAEGLEPMVANAIYGNAIGGDAVQTSLLNNPEQAGLNILRAGAIGGALGAPLGGAGVVMQNYQGKKISENAQNIYGEDGVKEMARQARESEDEGDAAFAQAVYNAINEGKGVANIQVAKLQGILNSQKKRDADRTVDAYNAAEKTIAGNNYSAPRQAANAKASESVEVARRAIAENIPADVEMSEAETNRIVTTAARIGSGVAGESDIREALSSAESITVMEAVTGLDLGGKSKSEQHDMLIQYAADQYVDAAERQTKYDNSTLKNAYKTIKEKDLGVGGQTAFDTIFEEEDVRGLADGQTDFRGEDINDVHNKMYTFEAFYRAGTADMTLEEIRQKDNPVFASLTPEQQEDAFIAGRNDALAEQNAAYLKDVQVGRKSKKAGTKVRPGHVTLARLSDENKQILTQSRPLFEALAKALGIEIEFRDEITDVNGEIIEEGVNGHYQDGKITISMDNDKADMNKVPLAAIAYVFEHEVTHHMKVFAPAEFFRFKQFVKNKMMTMDSSDGNFANRYEEEIAKKRRQYGNVEEDLLMEEILADATIEFIQDEEFCKEICEQDADTAHAIVKALRNLMDKIREIMANIVLTDSQRQTLFSELDILKDAEQMWLAGIRVAAERRNAVGEPAGGSGLLSRKKVKAGDRDSVKQQIRNNLKELNKMPIAVEIETEGFKGKSDATIVNEVSAIFNKSGNGVHRQDFGFISLEKGLIDDGMKYFNTDAERAALLTLPRVLKRGIIIRSKDEHKNRGYGTVTIAAPVSINGKRGNVGVVVSQTKGNRYKVLRILDTDGSVYEFETRKTETTTGSMTNNTVGEGLPIVSAPNIIGASDNKVKKSMKDLVTLSEQRIDNLIDEYAIPGNTTSDYSKAWITSINPRDFLKLTISDEELEKWTPGSTNVWGQEVRELEPEDLKAKGKYDPLMPFLKVNTSDSNSVFSHEGRHRMLALLRAGYEDVPVVIYDTSESAKSNRQYEEEFDLWSQDHGDGPVNSDDDIGYRVDVYDLIPINEKNRAEIERMYGGDTEVQFSRKYTPEEQQEHRDALLADCKECYGTETTDNFKETGYILPDGKMPAMGMYGIRGEDHRICGIAYDDLSGGEALVQFMSEGNIRIMPEDNSMELEIEPTAAQYDKIAEYVDQMDPAEMEFYPVRVDFADGRGYTADTMVFENPNSDIVVSSIKAHFAGGTVTPMRQFLSRKDSEGRYLSEGQMEYFKDSKARDVYGHLVPVYHSSDAEFTEFDREKLGESNPRHYDTSFGFFTTPVQEFSKRFGKNTKKMYADIRKPIIHPMDCHIKYPGREEEIVREWFEAVDPYQIPWFEELVETGEEESIYDAYMNAFAYEAFDYAEDNREALMDAGYDGIELVEGTERTLVKGSKSNDPVSSFIVFYSSQLKDVDNLEPTRHPDILMSRKAADALMGDSLLREGRAVTLGEVDEGELIPMYHGSGAANFDQFNLKGGMLGEGSYFTSSFTEAADYAIDALGIDMNEDGDYEWNGEVYDRGSLEDELAYLGYLRGYYLNITDEKDITRSKYGGGEHVIAVARSNDQIMPIEERQRHEISRMPDFMTPLDAEYFAALERQDWDEAQRLVDEAAEEAGYVQAAAHGTDQEFNVFNTLSEHEFGAHFGTEQAAKDIIGAHRDEDNAQIYNVFLDLGNTIEMPDIFGDAAILHDYVTYINEAPYDSADWDEWEEKNNMLNEEQAFDDPFFNTQEELPENEDFQKMREIINEAKENAEADGTYSAYVTLTLPEQMRLSELNQKYMKGLGYDSVTYENVAEDPGSTSYIIFDPSQIKDASVATFDDDGNIIPLSQRFNRGSDDIRYSRKTEVEAFPKKDMGEVKVTVRQLRERRMIDRFGKRARKKVAEVNAFMDELGNLMTEATNEFKYIGLEDVEKATVQYRRDENGNPTEVILTCQVNNGEYEVNYDLSTICKKREAMQALMQRLFTEKIENGDTLYDSLDLNDHSIWLINEELKKAGFETACPICFVETKRFYNQQYAEDIVNIWNAALERYNKEHGIKESTPFDFMNANVDEFDYKAIADAFDNYTQIAKAVKAEKNKNRKKGEGEKGITYEEKVKALIESGEVFRHTLSTSDILSPEGTLAQKAMAKGDQSLFGYLKKGSGAPKEAMAYTAYNGEIALLPDVVGKDKVDLATYLYSIAGARMQSFSDFQIQNIYDYVQMVADLAARALPAHAYTKEISFAKLFGMTGIKINLSVVCDIDPKVPEEYAGLTQDENGDWVYNVGSQSIDFDEAVKLQETDGYSKNCGIIMVGMSDNHVLKSLDDPNVRFVIPYHSSSMPVDIKNVTHIKKARDYTSQQNTTHVTARGAKMIGIDVEKRFKELDGDGKKLLREFNKKAKEVGFRPESGHVAKVKEGSADFPLYEDLQKTKNPRKTADNYINWCLEQGYLPLFYEFAAHKNYYKVLFDFNMYDCNTGRYAPQTAVQNIYPGINLEKGETDSTEFEDMIRGYMDEQNKINKRQSGMLDEVLRNVKERIPMKEPDSIKWSMKATDGEKTGSGQMLSRKTRDDEYIDAIERDDIDAVQDMLDQAAKDAGYPIKVFHGTPDDGFTVFIPDTMGYGFSWFTEDVGYADTYANRDVGYEDDYTPGIMAGYLKDDYYLDIGSIEGNIWGEDGDYSEDMEHLAELVNMSPDDLFDEVKQDPDFDDIGEIYYLTRTKAFADIVRGLRYKGIKAREYLGAVTYGVLDSSAFKRTGLYEGDAMDDLSLTMDDIVQRDNAGNIIPLSERFNMDEKDIRYSLKAQPVDVDEDEVSDIMASDPTIVDTMYGWGMATPEGQNLHEQTKEELIAKIEKLKQDMTLTEGKILDEKSVREEMNKLVVNMGIEEDRWTGQMLGEVRMNKTNRQLVESLVGTAKIIWKELQNGNYEAAVISAMNVSEHVVDNLLLTEDTMYKEYKELVDYLKNTKWELNPIYHGDFADGFVEFKKEYRGKIRIVKSGGRSPDELWGEMCELWPEFFTEDITNPAEMMKRMAEVRDSLDPYSVMLSEENQQLILRDAASDIIEIVSNGKPLETWADKRENYYREKIAKLKARQQEAIRDIKERQNWKDAEKKLATQMAEGKKKAQQQRAKQESKEKKADDKGKRQTIAKISKNLDWLSGRLLKPSDDKHLPEGYRNIVAQMLAAIDPQTERSKALEEKYGVSKKRFKWLQLRSEYERIASGESYGFILDDQIMADMQELSDVLGDGDFALANMTYDELQKVYRIVRSIRHGIQMQNKMFSDELKGRAEDYGRNAIETAETYINDHGTGRKGVSGKIQGSGMPLLDEGMLTPRDYFEYIGGGLNEAFLAMRRGQDEQIKKINYMRSFFESIFRDYGKTTRVRHRAKPGSELEAWRDGKNTKSFQCEGGTIELTPSQVMSLYCLMKREQAQGHILGSGIKAAVVNKKNLLLGENLKEFFTGKGDKKTRGRRVSVTAEDIMNIVSSLTEEQRDIADKMQTLMSTVMSDWGNEASMKMFGYRKFTEENYFPIECESTYLATDFDVRQTAERVKNPNFAKSTQKGANNPVVIDDIFSVCADHCNRMAMYSSYAPAIADFQRVYNFVDRDPETGLQNGSVKESLQAAYGDRALKYIERFMTDLNGTTPTTHDDLNRFVAKSLANYKKAAIGGNLRVAVQQPTAMIRALLYISPKYFMGKMSPVKEIREMKEHCPIALWKSWGFSQVDMARDLEDIMMNQEWSRFDMLTMEIYNFLDLVTWGQIWRAVKNEVKAEHKDVEVGSDEFYRLCNERASYIFDKSQVVDSVFHKSQVMRNTDVMSKMLTSFMAEPTRTFNMVGSEIQRAAKMWQDGDKSGAMKVYTKAFNVFILNAATVSAAAAVVDMMRGKGGDDDDDDDKLSLMMQNFIENMKSNALPHTFIPGVSDVVELFTDSWGAKNMSLEGYEKLAKAVKDMFDEDKTWAEKIKGLVENGGYVFGIPSKNIMRELQTALDILGIEVHAAEETDEVEEVKLTDKFFGMFKGEDKKSEKNGGKKKDDKEKEELDDYIDTTNEHGLVDKVLSKAVDEGSRIDKFLDKHGLTLTDEEVRRKAIKEKVEKVKAAGEGKTGDEKLDAIWKKATKGYTKYLNDGDLDTLKEMRQVLKKSGGDVDKFDESIMSKIDTAYKKTIGDMDSLDAQDRMRDYMLDHGMTAEQISSDIVYKSDTAKKFAIAAQEGKDKKAVSALADLLLAGMTIADANKLWENRWRYGGKGKGHGTGQFSWPCSGTITSYFGRRNAPTRGASSNHPSIDIGVSSGTQICAADGGVVIYTGYNGGYGNSVGIDHGNGFVTYYNHLSSWQVEKGARIRKGQPIALSGSTGVSTGPHLDFKILKDGTPVDPMKYLN